MIRVQLNENTFVDVEGTTDPRQAAAAGRRWFQQNRPEEFEAWRRSQLGLGSSATRGLSAGIDQFQSSLYSAAEGLGRAVGSEGLERFGRAGRIEQQLQAEAAFPSELRQPFTEVEGIGGAARATTEAVAGSLPSTAAGLAGALTGAKLGSALGVPGAVVGGLLGGAAASFPQLFGTNIERQIQESGDIISPGAAAAAAAVQAPLESAADIASLGAARVFRRPATEAAQAAGAGLGRRLATGAAVGAAVETPVEVAQTALERQQAGLPVFTTEGGAGREYLEAGFGGAAAGGVTGAALRGAFGERPAPAPTPAIPEGAFEPAPAAAAAAPAPTAEPRFAPLTIPDRPEPFTTREDAEAFVAANPAATPPISPETSPTAYVNMVNAARLGLWEQSVTETKTQAVNDFFPRAPDTQQIVVPDALNNLAEAAGRGDLNLNAFSPNAAARAALASRDIDPNQVTPAQVSEAARQLEALADTGVIRRNVTETTSTEKGKKVKRRKTTYAVNFGARPEAQPTTPATPTPETAGRPEVIPPAAEGAPIPQAAPTQAAPPVTGFTTALGSTYTINEQGQTIRTKQSPGRGQGTTYDPHNVLFVKPEDADSILEEYRQGNPYRFIVNDPAGPRRIDAGESLQGKQVALGIFTPEGQLIRYVDAQTTPAVGLSPVELRVEGTGENRTTRRHIGNPITAINQAAPAAAPAQPTARTTVEVDGVRRETTPETLQQTVDEMRAAPPTPKEAELAQAAANLDPASGAGETTRTAEEALLNTPKNMSIAEQRKILDAQYRDVFAGGKWRKFLASPLTGISRQPEHQEVAGVGTNFVGLKYKGTSDFAASLDPIRTLSPESQARTMLTLQEASSRRKMWNRDAFTAEENAAMDGSVATGQRGLDYLIDAYTRKYFDPNRAKTPDERTRLENFQRTKGDRLITAFSDAELRAVSENGAREVRDLNRRRNPFFFPQVATGSHFVAAYERKPGGQKGNLVRIYFYNPLKGIQKLRRRAGMQRDFEALSIAALRQEFPDINRFIIMDRGIESTRDKQASKLKDSGEFIAGYLDELKRVSGADAQRVIDRLSKQIDKAQMDRFFRPNEDKLRAVTPWNAVDYARETLPNYYLALANIQARVAIQDDFVRAQRGLNNEEKDYWDKWLNFNSTPVEALGAGRAVAGAWFLGGNISTAMMQLTQNPVVLPARFARDGAGTLGTGLYLRTATSVYATADTFKVLGGELEYTKNVLKSKRFSADEIAALRQALKDGVVKPSTIINIRGQFDADDFRTLGLADQSATGLANGLNKLLDLSFRMLSTVDETNRVIAFLSGYRLAKLRPEVMSRAGKLDNKTYATPYEYARSVADETNFVGGPEDQPLIARFHPAAQVMTQFLSPSFKFLELFARSAAFVVNGLKKTDLTMAKAGAAMFGLMFVMQAMFAGLWSLPFADRLKELVEFVLSKAFDTEIDFEQEIEKLPIPSILAATLNYGLPHALNVATLSERMKIDVLPQGSISEWDVFSIFGPVGGLVEKAFVAGEAYSNNDWMGVAYALLPTALANVLKGGEIGVTGEQWTRAGGRIITPEQVQAASEQAFLPPALRQAIGFAPPEFADIRRAVRRTQEMREPLQRDTERANAELARILLRQYEAQIEGRTAEARTFAQQFQQRAAEIMREQEDKPEQFRVRLSRSAIEQRARQDLQGRGSLETLLRRAPAAQRPEIIRMYERIIRPPAD